jgi:hypothetical protein
LIFITNSLAAEDDRLPDHVINRNASRLESQGGGTAPEGGVKGQDGAMFTGCCRSWQQLSEDNNQSVCDKCEHMNNSTKKKAPNKKQEHHQLIQVEEESAHKDVTRDFNLEG